MESLSEFVNTNYAEAFLIYQNPPEDAEIGPKPDGPTGWRACRNQLERSTGGGEVVGVQDGNALDGEAIEKAVLLALMDGAGILRIECEGMDRRSVLSLMQRVPALASFISAGGKILYDLEVINPDNTTSLINKEA